MPTTIQDIDDHVRNNTGTPVVEKDAGDVPAPDPEAVAIYNSIALNLLLRPKAVLYLSLLAKNALVRVCQDELADIDTLTQTLLDLGNITLDIADVQDLVEARNALIELEKLDRIDTTTPAYSKYLNSVNDFLARLAKNVKAPGATTLRRPSAEAAKSLVSDYNNVATVHSDLIERLNSLAVGVDNFKASTLQTVLGQIAVTRAKIDIEDVIKTIQADHSGSASKEITIRLLSSRAAVKASANFATVDDLLIDDSHPVGYTDVVATSSDQAVVINTAAGPYTPLGGWSVTYNDGTTSVTNTVPQSDADYSGFGYIASAAVTYPVTIGAGKFFYIKNGPYDAPISGGTYPWENATKVAITSGSRTIAQIITDINAVGGGNFAAREFIIPGSSRIVIYSLTSNTINITSNYLKYASDPFLAGVAPITEHASCHTICGFEQESTGTSTLKNQDLVDAFNSLFSTVATTTLDPTSNGLVFTSVRTAPGTSVNFIANDGSNTQPFGFPSITQTASSLTVSLSGTINGIPTNSINPSEILDPGDLVTINGVVHTIDSITTSNFNLASPITTVSEATITANSAVKFAHDSLNALLKPFMQIWSKGSYFKNLDVLNRVIAPLRGDASLASINNALAVLTDLRSNIQSLVTLLQNSNTVVSLNAGTREKEVVNGIISTLQERKYDRALAAFMKCEVLDMFQMNSDTSSYAGNVQSAMTDIAQTDVDFPNQTKGKIKTIGIV
jgi:hypothetical protein